MTSAVDDEIGSRRDEGSDRTTGSRSTVRAEREVRVAVVGSGVAGAGAAYSLGGTDVSVTVFEREAEVGGRTTTARRGSVVYDYGANYVKPGTERVAELVGRLDEGDLVDVTEPVWTVDADGAIAPGDEDRADDHKWTFEDGLATLPRRLLERSGVEIRTGAHVTSARRFPRDDHDRWYLQVAGERVGPYDAVVLTPPGPETGGLLATESVEPDDGETESVADDRIGRVAAAANSVTYRPIGSVVLHYPFAIETPYYALVNVDGEHRIDWVSREDRKRGHVPPGETVLVAQLSSARTRETSGWADGEVADGAAATVAELVGDDRLADPDWHQVYRFQRALPVGRADADPVDASEFETAESHGLYVAGDWVRVEGRIHAALSDGLGAGDRLGSAIRSDE